MYLRRRRSNQWNQRPRRIAMIYRALDPANFHYIPCIYVHDSSLLSCRMMCRVFIILVFSTEETFTLYRNDILHVQNIQYDQKGVHTGDNHRSFTKKNPSV